MLLSFVINLILFAFILPNINKSFPIPESNPVNITIVSQIETTEIKSNIDNFQKSEDDIQQSSKALNEDPIIKALSEYSFPKKDDSRMYPTKPKDILQTNSNITTDKVSNDVFSSLKSGINKKVEFTEKRIELEEISQEKIIAFEELAKIGIPNFASVQKDLQNDYQLKLKNADANTAKSLRGEVIVQINIDKDGRVNIVNVISAPNPILADIAVRNILKLRASPRTFELKGLRVRIDFERK
jgi:hypothetical protein